MLPEPLQLTIIPADTVIWDGQDRVVPGFHRLSSEERELIRKIVELHSQFPACKKVADTTGEERTFISSPDYNDGIIAFFTIIQELAGQVDYTASPVRMWLAQPDFIGRVQFPQLRIVLVWLVRGEHFCSGFWEKQFDNDFVSKLVRRLIALEDCQGDECMTIFKIDEKGIHLTPIPRTTLVEMKILERRDLQELIQKSFPDIAAAMDEYRLVLIGKEVLPSPVVSDRIDLLAVDDDDGTIVVIELKRAKHKLQLLQALSYAAMISECQKSDLQILPGVESKEIERLEVNQLTNRPRLILMAEDFDFQVLKTAQWLRTQSIEVKCVRVAVSEDKEAHTRFLSFSVVFPPREIEEEAKMKRLPKREGAPSADWKEFLAQISNEALRSFVASNLSLGRENQFAYRTFHFRIQGSRHFQVWIRPTSALVEQIGRFDNDWAFWKARLSPEAGTTSREVYNGDRLRFELLSPDDFTGFTEAVGTDLKNVEWKAKLAQPDGELNG